MRPQFCCSIGKRTSEPHLNEDAVATRWIAGLYAVSDGASESYNSALWAKQLVAQFLRSQRLSEDWLRDVVTQYNARFDRAAMSWSAQAAFDRGSYATLTGIMLSSTRKAAAVLGIGDSLAVLADGDHLVTSFPYEQPDQFSRSPLLLSTLWERNAAILGRWRSFARLWALDRLRNPAILCMTDALGAWLLKEPSLRLPKLLRLRTKIQFEGFVERERATGNMRRDDTTLLVIR